MIGTSLDYRVTNLEQLMERMLAAQERAHEEAERTSREMRVFQNEMAEFKGEMSDFKDEMSEFKNKTDDAIIQMRKQWGELANKMGTMAEDLVAPSIPPILRTVVGCPEERIESTAVRARRRHPADSGQMQEFDVIATCGEYLLVNETKSALSPEAIERFAQRLPGVREYFPEYAAKKVIGAIASLYVDESLVRYGESLGLIVLGFGQDVMSVLDSPGFTPKVF
ncbi:MAG: hypothetical protein JW850_05155 [Thermoflexales bacterium]|nr:hypothetical protein [Thermoflexales bacterium]